MAKDWADIAARLKEMATDVPVSGPGTYGQMIAFTVAVRQAEALALLLADIKAVR